MDYAFILDPLPELKAYKDSSIAMMRSLAARGHAIYALEQSDLFWGGDGTRARVVPLTLKPDDHDWYEAGVPENRALRDFAAVLMRKDPPFDMEYVYSTYLLEAAEREGARVFNRPRAIRDHNEKFAIARFGEFIAPTLVTRDAARIDAFIDAQGDTIVKPLDGMGGTSVFRVRADDPNRNVIVETVGQHGATDGDGAALHPGDHGRRQADAADRRRAGAVRAGAHPEGGRDARQPRGRRPRRRAPPHAARPPDRGRAGTARSGPRASSSSAST